MVLGQYFVDGGLHRNELRGERGPKSPGLPPGTSRVGSMDGGVGARAGLASIHNVSLACQTTQ